MTTARHTWRWMGLVWLLAGGALTALMIYLGVATLVDLGWQARAIGAFGVAGVGFAMTSLGLWTVWAEFARSPSAPDPRMAEQDR